MTVATLAIALMGVVSAPAGAESKLNSFEGECSFQGTSYFSPPATNFQQSLDVTYAGPGTCSGTLNGRSLSDASVTAHNTVSDVDGSCLRADTTRLGRGSITFPGGVVLRFLFEFHFVGTEGEFVLYGRPSGQAHGQGSFMTERTPPDLALKCAGEGVSEAPLDISFETTTPLVSKRRGR
jgi:hypothetical protein